MPLRGLYTPCLSLQASPAPSSHPAHRAFAHAVLGLMNWPMVEQWCPWMLQFSSSKTVPQLVKAVSAEVTRHSRGSWSEASIVPGPQVGAVAPRDHGGMRRAHPDWAPIPGQPQTLDCLQLLGPCYSEKLGNSKGGSPAVRSSPEVMAAPLPPNLDPPAVPGSQESVSIKGPTGLRGPPPQTLLPCNVSPNRGVGTAMAQISVSGKTPLHKARPLLIGKWGFGALKTTAEPELSPVAEKWPWC